MSASACRAGAAAPSVFLWAGRAVLMEELMEVMVVLLLLPWCLLSEPPILLCTSGSAGGSVLSACCPSRGAAPLCLSVPLRGGEGRVFWSITRGLSPKQSREGWIGTLPQHHLFGNPLGVQLVGADVVPEDTLGGGWS